MIKQSFTLSVTMLILSFLCPAFLNAQIVTDERMFSFEEPQLPACITGVQSQLGISGAHYKDGKHSLEWTFEPNGKLELRKDLKFEKKDPTGKTCIFPLSSYGYTMSSLRTLLSSLNF